MAGCLKVCLARRVTSPPPDKRLLSIDEACHVLGLGRTSIYAAIKRADLKILKYGRRSLILATEIEAFISKLSHNQQP